MTAESDPRPASPVHRRCTRCRDTFQPQANVCGGCSGERYSWGFRLREPKSNGKREKTRHYGYTSFTEATRARRDLLAAIDNRTHVPAARRTVAGYLLEEWIPGRKKRVARTTWAQQRQQMRDHVAPYFTDRLLQDWEPNEWRAHLAFLAERGNRATGAPLAAKTVHTVHMTVHKALQDAIEDGYLNRNIAGLAGAPLLDPPRPHAIWTPDQLAVFLESQRDHRNLPYYLLIAGTALRRGEALGIHWPQLDLDRAELQVWNNLTVAENDVVWSNTKGKRRRTLSLDPLQVTTLRRHRLRLHQDRLKAGRGWHQSNLVFPKQDGDRQDPRTVSQYFERACGRAGLPHIGLHGLRHTYATHAITNGVPTKIVADILGHARTSIR